MPDKGKLQKEIDLLWNMKPEKAIAYLNKKIPMGPNVHWDWTDTLRHSHDRIFVISKATNISIVKDIHKALVNSMENGIPYEQFANSIVPTLRANGWWGRVEAINKDTGDYKNIRVDHRRLRTIYVTNMKTAYDAGKYEQMMDEVDVAPYWRFVAIPKGTLNKNPRPEHAALHNMVLRYDDPFRKIFFGHKGWNCHCSTKNYTKRGIQKLFGKPIEEVVQKSDPNKFVTKTEIIQGKNITTQGYKIGSKEVYPDAGWDYAPGAYNALLAAQKNLFNEIEKLENSKVRKKMRDEFNNDLKSKLATVIEEESKLPLNQKDKIAIATIPGKIQKILKNYPLENGRTINLENPLLSASLDAIYHAQRPRKKSDWGKSIPIELFKNLPDLLETYELRIEPDTGALLFYSNPFKHEDKMCRYKIVFAASANFKEYTLKTAGRVAAHDAGDRSIELK